MANPNAIFKTELNIANVGRIRRAPDPGSLEPDDFVINDVPLRIPPQQINIQKESFNNEWNTLRTQSARKAKSGYGLARVNISTVFRVHSNEDDYDANALSQLVAGLRATPFCVVYNDYLDRILGRPDDETPIAKGPEDPSSKAFQPIMLALASMTFSTMGHEGKPDCITANFDFIWFNYLPFTKHIAFKSGPELDKPGFPWQSPIWQAFYEPFYYEQIPISFPHDLSSSNRVTEFMWREFLLVPKGSPLATQAAKDLAETLRNRPQELTDEFASIIQQGTNIGVFESSNLSNPDSINEGTLDSLYRVAIQKGFANPSEEVRKVLATMPGNAITEVAGPILFPVLKKLYASDSGAGISGGLKNELDVAAALLSERLKKIESVKRRGDLAFSTIDSDGQFVQLLDADAKESKKSGSSSYAGGLSLFGRKRRLQISHNGPEVLGDDTPKASGAIIEQIVVSFQNILATLPMLAYRYPTVQHVGSIDAQITMSINSTTYGAEQIRKMYDRIETGALRYKQVPAGFTNLNIRNDFLNLFGINEFLTESLEVSTIPGQPGRSRVNLTLSDAGLTSKDKDTEQLQQEFVQADSSISESIWRILKQNLTFVESGKDYKNLNTEVDEEYYYMRSLGVKKTGSNKLYATLVGRVVEIYNEFLENVHISIFNTDNINGSKNYTVIRELTENSPGYGYLPGIRWIQRSLQKRNKAYYDAKEKRKIRTTLRLDSDKELKRQQRANLTAKEQTGNDAFNTKVQQRFIDERARRLNGMGLSTYQQKINALLQEISQNYLTLDKFQNLLKRKDSLGLEKGLMAYNDFKKQLTSVAKLAEGTDSKQMGDLLKYDPDCYFYYPFLNGGNNSPLSGLVDPYYLTAAEIHSKKIHDTATNRISDFFGTNYQNRMNNPVHKRPYDSLAKSIPPPFYTEPISNSSQAESLQKTVVPDSGAKIHTNWYPSVNPPIKSNNVCYHSTDMNQLWNGVAQDASGNASFGSGQDISPSPNDVGSGNGKWLTESAPGLEDDNRWPKLKQLRVEAQPAFNAMLNGLAAAGFQPEIRDVYRSPQRQREKLINGYSKPSATKVAKQYLAEGKLPTGTSLKEAREILLDRGIIELNVGYHTWGLAIDVIPKGWNWKTITPEVVKFFKTLRELARKNGLNSGGWWKQRNPAWAEYGIGWDPAHVQMDRYNSQRVPSNWREDVMKYRRRKGSAQRYKPPVSVQRQLAAQKSQTIGSNVTATVSSPLRLAVQDFERDLYNGQAQSMMRAYPAFKLYFIEDDSGEEAKRLQFDDFFSYNSVQSIRIIGSRKIAADLCEIYLTNISGILSNRKFRNSPKGDQPHTNTGDLAKENVQRANTSEENPIASLLLQQGMNIHLRLGYCNDPDRMESRFNGTITEVQFSESDDLVRIVAQSYATEMVQDLKGIQKPIKKNSSSWFGWDKWGFGSNATTGRILEEMMAEPEMLHFGRWTATGGGANPARELLTQRWTYSPQPQDDNIFAPSNSQDIGIIGDGKFFKNLKYIIYRTTIWDICQEMTLRHPNFIASPVPYKGQKGERMTMFFGLPNQLYFARDPKSNELIAAEKLKRTQVENSQDIRLASTTRQKEVLVAKMKQLQAKGENLRFNDVRDRNRFLDLGGLNDQQLEAEAMQLLTQKNGKGYVYSAQRILFNAATSFYKQERLNQAKQAEYIKPFRNYHLITSSQHIIQNNIKANARDVANTIVIKYGKDVEITDDASGNRINGLAIKGEEQEFTLKLDAALPTEEIRTQMGQFVNVTHEELAKRYALGLLMRNLKDVYKGEIVIVGNPKIKPYDVVYMFDEYSDMTGAFEVEEVQHIFDQQHGFRTEIKPDMLVQAQEFSLLSSAEALGVVMEGALRKLGNKGSGGALLKSLAPNPYLMGHGLNLFGGFLAQKLVNFTQLAQPVIMSPLLHHGRMFTGGIPIRKIPTSPWTTMFGDWSSSSDGGYSDWAEDVADEMLGWVKTRSFRNTVGNFFNTGGNND